MLLFLVYIVLFVVSSKILSFKSSIMSSHLSVLISIILFFIATIILLNACWRSCNSKYILDHYRNLQIYNLFMILNIIIIWFTYIRQTCILSISLFFTWLLVFEFIIIIKVVSNIISKVINTNYTKKENYNFKEHNYIKEVIIKKENMEVTVY